MHWKHKKNEHQRNVIMIKQDKARSGKGPPISIGVIACIGTLPLFFGAAGCSTSSPGRTQTYQHEEQRGFVGPAGPQGPTGERGAQGQVKLPALPGQV